MSESAIADFTARFVLDGGRGGTPVRGRVVLSEKRLVVVSAEDKLTVPLSKVFDVEVGEVPSDVAQFFNDTVTVGFRRNGSTHTAAIEAESDDIERFGTLLYKARLSGLTAMVRHPVAVDGRLTGGEEQRSSLRVTESGLVCEVEPELTVDPERVVAFERVERRVDGTAVPMLAVTHTADGRAVRSEVALDTETAMNVLVRYLRRRYRETLSQVRDLPLTESESGALVGLYGGGTGVDLARLLDDPEGAPAEVLSDLREKELVAQESRGLTRRGMVAVADRAIGEVD
jgi:helix-turn-helix protein